MFDLSKIFEGTVSEIKKQYTSGQIDRNTFWLSMQNKFKAFDEIQAMLGTKKISLEISGDEIRLLYEFEQNLTGKLILQTNDLRSAPFHLLVDGCYENLEFRILKNIARVSQVFVDIGANVGFYSIFTKILKPDLEVHSVEPNPLVSELLIKNMELNNFFDNTKVYQFAVGDRNENEVLLNIPGITGSSGASLIDLHPDESGNYKVKVALKSLDSTELGNTKVDLVKMDIEGAEFAALLGFINTIKSNKPTIFIELLRKWMSQFDSKPQDVIDLLLPLGYKCFAIGHKRIIETDIINESTFENNFIFVHKQKYSHIDILRNYLNVGHE